MFVTLDSLEDERVTDHPKRLEVRSYCGVPLIGEDGRAFGTICHFDSQPLSISDENVELMEGVADLLSANLGVPKERPPSDRSAVDPHSPTDAA